MHSKGAQVKKRYMKSIIRDLQRRNDNLAEFKHDWEEQEEALDILKVENDFLRKELEISKKNSKEIELEDTKREFDEVLKENDLFTSRFTRAVDILEGRG
jgi:cell shape-determining protein MreC